MMKNNVDTRRLRQGLAIMLAIVVALTVVAWVNAGRSDASGTETVHVSGADRYGQYGGVKFNRRKSLRFARMNTDSAQTAATAMCGAFIAAGAPGVVATGACVYIVTHTYSDYRHAARKIRHRRNKCMEMRFHYFNPLSRITYAKWCKARTGTSPGGGGGSWRVVPD